MDDVSHRTFHVVQPRSGANLSDKTADGPLANPLGARERGGGRGRVGNSAARENGREGI